MNYKSALENKYKQILKIENFSTKDIIYFCRDALSCNNPLMEKNIYEEEILNIIKSKDWNYSYKDIDGCNLLLYPIRNNAFSIVNYLIDNKKYNLKEYNEDISCAISSCIMLTGEKMMHHLLSLDIHNYYITDMAFKSYTMSAQVLPQHKKDYLNKIKYLIENTDTDFKRLLSHFLGVDDFKKYKEQYLIFLQEHPLPNEDKLNIMKNELEPFKKNVNFINGVEKYKILNNWIEYYLLQDMLSNDENKGKKLKI